MNIAACCRERQGGHEADGAIAQRDLRPMIMGGSHKEGNKENSYGEYRYTLPPGLRLPELRDL